MEEGKQFRLTFSSVSCQVPRHRLRLEVPGHRLQGFWVLGLSVPETGGRGGHRCNGRSP